MKIEDFVMFLPRTMMSVICKSFKADIDDIGKEEILKNGLYHLTPDEETTEKIINSQHLRPSRTPIVKNIDSYGKASVFLFNGAPNIEQYIDNLVRGKNNNPYVNPTRVSTAVKISPKEKSELANYKVRSLEDSAIAFEGYCVIPPDEIKAVHLVPDLVRNPETGEPLINPKTGRYDVSFREALEEELSEDKKKYNAKEDYLQFMAQERERFGYIEGNNVISNTINNILSTIHVTKASREMKETGAKTNFFNIVKRKITQLTTPRLDKTIDERIYDSVQEFDYKSENPFRDKKFGEAVAYFQTQGLQQMELKDELEDLTTSNDGKYFRKKFEQIDKEPIISKGIHGISHNNRVALYSMLIAKNEGMLEDDLDNKTKDILLSASYYHDIGRKKGPITDNYGPHAKNSVRKIKKLDLKYVDGKEYTQEEKRIVQAVVEAHEGKDKDMIKICKKYNVNQEKMLYVLKLMAIIKDADALDRNRLDISLPVNVTTVLDPKYLRTDTSKRLLKASYQLKLLSQKVEFDRILAYKTAVQKEGGEIQNSRDKFVDYLKQGVSQIPVSIENRKKDLRLKKERYIAKFTGNNIIKKIKEEIVGKIHQDQQEER